MILLYLYAAMIFMFNGEEGKVVFIYMVYALCVIYLFLNLLSKRNGKLKYCRSIVLILFYILYSLISILWAPLKDQAVSRGKAVILLLILTCLCFSNYKKDFLGKCLINAIIIGGLCESIYVIGHYGVNMMLSLITTGIRLNDVAINNVNTLSNTLVIAIVATIAVIIFENNYFLLVALIPEFFVLVSFSSRTAFIALIVSSIIILVNYRRLNKIERRPEYRIIMLLVMIVAIVLIIQVLNGESAITSRFEGLFSFVKGTGEGGRNNSLQDRSDFVKLGLQAFANHPICGLGFANAGYSLISEFGYMTYLHNNYVEILASGGIIGFVLYYGFYFRLLRKHIMKLKSGTSLLTIISFVTLCCEMVTQIGIVTYYSKVSWLLMTLWIIIAESDCECQRGN